MTPTRDEVLAALRTVADPCAIATGVPVDVVAMGLVQDMCIESGIVRVDLRLTSPFCMQIGLIRDKASAAIGRLHGVKHVDIEVDHSAEWLPENMEPEARNALRRIRPLPLAVVE